MKIVLTGQVKVTLALAVIATANLTMASIVKDSSASNCSTRLSGKFTESAPRDRFRFVNASEPGWSVDKLSIALDTADGKLIFDTDDGGAGVEVFQPYRQESGTATVASVEVPQDGQQSITITFDDFPAGAYYAFSIDIDDTLSASELGNIRVTGGELNGTTVMASFVSDTGERQQQQTVFNDQNMIDTIAGCS
ncbi:MAG: hypothetical protein AAF404_16970 [Pseudomonadota bacterium]